MSNNSLIRTMPLMGTLVTIQIVGTPHGWEGVDERGAAIERAFAWFRRVEECCTRFDVGSELMRLCAQAGAPVPASTILYEIVQLAIAVAEQTGGAFDPTVGQAMEARGFNREYRTRQIIHTPIEPAADVSYRDVRLDSAQRTILLLRPMILDLGAIAKGFAVDLAARELQPFANFAINAGGDLYLGGHNPGGRPWSIGIGHPRLDGELIDSICVSGRAVCTSGDYARRSPGDDGGHHLIDPLTGASPLAVASVTVVAPTAALADALATAAFVLGPAAGIALFERLGVDGLIISPALERFATRGMSRDYQLGGSAVFSHSQGTSHHYSGDPSGVRDAD